MIDTIKKTMFMGLGLANITREKIEEVVSELKVQGAISESEGKKLVDEFLERKDKARSDMEKMIEAATEKAFERLNLARKSDVEEIKEMLTKIQERQKGQDVQEK